MVKNDRIPIIGLTGGAGSGKSHIAALLGDMYHICHINTDQISKAQMMRGGYAYDAVVEHFGCNFLDEHGEIDRGKLGEYIFNKPEELEFLNSVTHPAVKQRVEQIIQECSSNQYELILLETALLIEAGYTKRCDAIWYIYATRAVRKQRLIQSRGYSDSRIHDMFRRQNTDRFFRKNADVVIDNSNKTEEQLIALLKKQVKRLKNNQK